MRLWAISDLHLASAINRDALAALPDYGPDWLILAGDVAERSEHFHLAFRTLTRRFARVIWTPGNHDLWTVTDDPEFAGLGGDAKYRAIVELARSYGVATPEDPWPVWTGDGGPCVLAPLFTLYDYSFRPAEVARADVVAWAREGRAACADELFLNPAPYASREDWCRALCATAEARLSALEPALPTVLINHYPLRRDLVRLRRIPRFAPWCGTERTAGWAERFRARTVVYGHLHIRRSEDWDGVRYEEVSLGYPKHWDRTAGIAPYLRPILPAASP
ncbi:MAG: metallophosphoesterase [Alphaproteobacteria bacterium]|nr:metallophosphoesterase [Alphaproteobacteria bacterium]MCB9931133.1 metallophosphoesterase [Alphaproteobacteria bacterium]